MGTVVFYAFMILALIIVLAAIAATRYDGFRDMWNRL